MHKQVYRYDFWTKNNDELDRTIWKTYDTLNKIRNIKSTGAKHSFFKTLEKDLKKFVQDPK